MEKNIIALLNKNLRVIIPDFGAFILRQKQPRIIVFNEFLRYNDGLLIDFIIKTEGIDREIAEQRVNDFADEANRMLDGGKELVIEGLGVLHKEASGKINFTEMDEMAEMPDRIVEEPVKPEKPEINAEPVIAEKPVKTEESFITEELVKAEEPAIEEEPAKKEETVKAEEPANTEEPVQPIVKEVNLETPEPKEIKKTKVSTATTRVRRISKETFKDIPAGEPAPPPPVKIEEPAQSRPVVVPSEPPLPEKVWVRPVAVEPEMKERPQPDEPVAVSGLFTNNRTNRVLGWILIVLFVNAVILGWFVFKDKIRGLFGKKAAPVEMITDSIYEQLADSVKAAALDTSLVYMQTAEEQMKTARKEQLSTSRFYIVAGCFRDEANAETLVSSLKSAGYKAEKFGKIGNLYAVCFASFDDKDQAVQELKRIREKAPDAWMTRF
jgi:nucleoid DNA-binding protein